MSKLAVLRQYRYSPAAGGIFGTIGKLISGGVKLLTGVNLGGSKAAAVQAPQVKLPAGVGAGMSFGVNPLLKGGGGSRKGRGITARELRGYRKVANLLHKEGMVSKKARRGK